MSQIIYLVTLIGCLLAGFLLGRMIPFAPQKLVELLTAWVLYLLIFTMGFRIGRTEEVTSGFARLGLVSFLYALSTTAGTILALLLLYRLVFRPDPSSPADRRSRPETGKTPLRVWPRLKTLAAPLRLLGVLVLGLLAGYFLPVLRELRGESATTWTLYFLLFLIGITVRRSGIRFREVVDPSLWILPLGTILGSLAGGLLLALILRQRIGQGLALASGFGWYSLSGVLLIQLDGPSLGATAFLSNMMREALALIVIPLLARTRYPLICIGVGGATSMDVTLPIIEVSCGPRAVPFSIASGVVLSASVPLLVPLLYALG